MVAGGLDCIVEIPKRKWDIDDYYAEDIASVDGLTMYTRHMGVVDVCIDEEASHLQRFGLGTDDWHSCDMRCSMLICSVGSCLGRADLEPHDIKDKDLGIFCGLSGNDAYFNFMTAKTKASNSRYQVVSNASIVNRISYQLGSTGPTLALDTEESSGSAAVDNAVTFMRMGRCGPHALAAGVNVFQHPLRLAILCNLSVVSRIGRSMVFDESSDGTVHSEGVVTILLRTHDSGTSDENVLEYKAGFHGRALLEGSAANSMGTSTSLSAPSSIAIRDVVQRALKTANVPPTILDAVEVNATGGRLSDASEFETVQSVLTSSAPAANSIALRSLKALCGETGAPSGLASIVRACLLLERGLHSPSIHLKNTIAGCSYTSSQRLHLPLEIMEAHAAEGLIGITSVGSTGTSVHHQIWGRRLFEQHQALPSRPILWFPAARTSEAECPKNKFYIVGSWNGWEAAEQMESLSAGVFSHTFTLGDTCMETFHVWMDGDPNKVLHPPCLTTCMISEVCGPHEGIGQDKAWCINVHKHTRVPTKSQQVQEIQENPTANMFASSDRGVHGESPDMDSLATLSCYTTPQEYHRAPSWEEVLFMPDFGGAPGDRYRIVLHMRGRYRKMEWGKLST